MAEHGPGAEADVDPDSHALTLALVVALALALNLALTLTRTLTRSLDLTLALTLALVGGRCMLRAREERMQGMWGTWIRTRVSSQFRK